MVEHEGYHSARHGRRLRRPGTPEESLAVRSLRKVRVDIGTRYAQARHRLARGNEVDCSVSYTTIREFKDTIVPGSGGSVWIGRANCEIT